MLLHRHPLDEAPPVEPLRPVPATTRRPLRIDEQARAHAALAGLYIEDRALGMRIPDATVLLRNPAPVHIRPEASLLASAAVISTLCRAYGNVADELESALAELAELVPFTAKAGC